MTFPTIPTTGNGAILTTGQTTATTTHTFPNLTTLAPAAGDLLIAIICCYQGGSANAEFSAWGGSFTEFVDQSANSTTIQSIGAAYKFATGSETGTFTVTSVASTRSAMILMQIPGAHASTPPEATAKADGTAAAADPAALDPAGWAAEDTLWIAVGASGETSLTGSFTGLAAAPTNYVSYFDTGINGGDVVGAIEGAVAFRQLNAASEDVGGFSVDTSNAGNSALLIAVRPAAVLAVLPRPTVVPAWGYAEPGFVGWTAFKADFIAATDVPKRALVVPQQPIPPQAAYVLVGRPPTEFVAPPPEDGRIQPLVVGAQQWLPSSGTVTVFRTGVPADVASRPVVVSAQPPSVIQPFVAVGAGKAEPPAAPPPEIPPKPTVVVAQPLPTVQPFVSIFLADVEPPVAPPEVPPKPTIVQAWTPVQPGFVGWTSFNVDSGIIAATDAPKRALVVLQQPLLPQAPFVTVVQPKVFAAPPVVGDTPAKPTVVRAQELPPPVDQIILYTVVSQGLVQRSTVVDAGPLPLGKPFTYVGKGSVPLAPEPPVPIKSTVVDAGPMPPAVQPPQIAKLLASPPVFPEIRIPPTVVGQQPIPWQQQQPNQWISKSSRADPDKLPAFPTIAGGASLAGGGGAFVHKTYPFTPPPRIIQPQVNVDMSLPFRPNGWVRVAHGFAEALPLLFEGIIVGGIRPGSGITGSQRQDQLTGGIRPGSGITGSQRQDQLTGGQRQGASLYGGSR